MGDRSLESLRRWGSEAGRRLWQGWIIADLYPGTVISDSRTMTHTKYIGEINFLRGKIKHSKWCVVRLNILSLVWPNLYIVRF